MRTEDKHQLKIFYIFNKTLPNLEMFCVTCEICLFYSMVSWWKEVTSFVRIPNMFANWVNKKLLLSLVIDECYRLTKIGLMFYAKMYSSGLFVNLLSLFVLLPDRFVQKCSDSIFEVTTDKLLKKFSTSKIITYYVREHFRKLQLKLLCKVLREGIEVWNKAFYWYGRICGVFGTCLTMFEVRTKLEKLLHKICDLSEFK